MSDLVLNVKQISNYPAKTNATGLENLLLQSGLGAPYQSITSGALVATALENAGSMGIGYGLPATPPPTSGQLFASNFIAPINGGFQFNTYLDGQGTLRYWNTGPAADWAYDQNAGFIWRRFPDGSAGSPITLFPAPLMALSQSGHLTLYFDTLTVVRDPSAPFEVATANWVSNNTVQSFNNRQGPVKLNAQDVYTALQLTSPIATQDYTNQTISSSIQNLLLTCPFVNSWNGRSGSVYLTLSDITCVFFQSGQQPISPTPPATSDDNSIATTAWVTQHVGMSIGGGAIIANAPPSAPFPGELWFDTVSVQLYVWYDDGTSQQWVIANNAGGGGGSGGTSSNLLISASPPLSPTLGTLWWNTIDGNSYVYYSDGTSSQWVPATSTAGVVGGPFLPISGGTVNGNVTVNGRTTLNADLRGNAGQSLGSGGNFWGYGIFSSAVSGVRTGGDSEYFLIQTTSDTIDAPAGLIGLHINLHSGGTGTSGNRVGQWIETHHSGSTLDKARGYNGMYAGQWVYAYGEGSAGGTAGAGNSFGSLWGGLSSARLMSGATYWNEACGHEIDVGVASGASAAFVRGLKVIIQGHGQAAQSSDIMVGLAKTSLTDQAMMNGIMFGSLEGYWPIAPAGTLIGTQPSQLATPPAMTATNGIDLSAVTFSGMAFKSNGFQVDANGYFTGAGGSLTNALHFTALSSSPTDLTHGLDLNVGAAGMTASSGNATNFLTGGGGVFVWYIGGSNVGTLGSSGLNSVAIGQSSAAAGSFSSLLSFTSITTGGTGGPTWTSGAGAPSATAPAGSLYSRTAGATGTRLYVSAGGGTWNPVAGV